MSEAKKSNGESSLKRTKEEILKKRKLNKVLLILGIVLCVLFLGASIFFTMNLMKLNMLPMDYVLKIGILLGLFFILIAITQRWKVPGIIMKAVALLLSVIMLVGSVKYIIPTYQKISDMTTITKTTVIGIYVLEDSPTQSVEEIQDGSFGYMADRDTEYTNDAVADIEKELNKKLNLVSGLDADGDGSIGEGEQFSLIGLADALLEHKIDAMLINRSNIGAITNIKGYEEFEDQIRLLKSVEKEEEITVDPNKDNQSISDGHVFTLYISGVDIEGSPAENRNSDVNILLTINKKTKQVLLLNTPRDYYVGVQYITCGEKMDKLTHAGCEGVDCSIATLEKLYNIEISGYLKVNFTGFKKIIDALGGVNVWSEYDFTSYHGKYHFNKGYNQMTGAQALGFARERYSFGSGDNQRGRNQMEVIKAIIEKMESSDMLLNYDAVLDSLSASMVTSLTYDEISELVQFQVKEMPKWDININAVTGHGGDDYCYRLGFNNYVMYPNEETVVAARQYMEDMYNDKMIDVKY